MNRVQILLAGLAGILVVVLFWLLLWAPQQDELDDLRAETEEIENDQQQTATRIAALEAVRDEAPEQEARLVAANTVIPQGASLPGFLRQVQQAADDAGMTLEAVSPARPSPVDGPQEGLHSINVAVELQGTYFQLVDLLRRVEDPSITARGIVWNAVNISGDADAHPTLNVSLQGDVYAVLPTPPADVPEDEEEDDDADDADDNDADVEVEIED